MHVANGVPVHEVRGAEFADFDLPMCEQKRGMVADGAFAVGACNMDRLPWETHAL